MESMYSTHGYRNTVGIRPSVHVTSRPRRQEVTDSSSRISRRIRGRRHATPPVTVSAGGQKVSNRDEERVKSVPARDKNVIRLLVFSKSSTKEHSATN